MNPQDSQIQRKVSVVMRRERNGRCTRVVARMQSERPPSGETLNSGPATTPRQAASVILLRGGAAALELLLVRRNLAQRFMPGFWVFPGGAVDGADGEGDAAHRAAGVRELAEEAGVEGVDVAQ